MVLTKSIRVLPLGPRFLQEIAQLNGAEVGAHTHREYGFARVTVKKTGNEMADRLFEGLECEDEGGMQVSARRPERAPQGASRDETLIQVSSRSRR